MKQGEIITIGDELLSGRVCDVNSFFLSGRISSYGLKIKAFSSVGDEKADILEVLGRAVDRSDFVLVSGGLGPTDDDITAEVAAEFFGLPLEMDETFLGAIRKSVSERGLPWSESYRKLALIPKGSELIDPNEACGFYLKGGDVPVFFLPGIPEEVRLLAESKVLPLLIEEAVEKSVVKQRLFKLFGLQEGEIGDTMNGVGDMDPGLMIGFYPNFPENHLTLTVHGTEEEKVDDILDRVEKEVEKRLGSFIVARGLETIEKAVGDRLRDRGLKIAVAESCTGGGVCSRLTSISGSSDYFERGIVAYSNDAKVELLNVPREIIKKHGAVSHETAAEMAKGVLRISRADIGLATTGVAGPTGGTREKPVGAVFIGLAASGKVRTQRFNFAGNRAKITALTAETALNWLKMYLEDEQFIDQSE